MVSPNKPVIEVQRNLMQLAVRMAPQKTVVVEAGRAAGKSTVLADKMEDIAHDMPRATNALVGVTYQQILTRTLPSTILSLSTLGYRKDVHFWVCKKPTLKRWDEPYEPPGDYGHAICWYNGAVWSLLSQDVNSRGINIASIMADELCLLDHNKLQSEVAASLRGQKRWLKNCRTWLCETYVSSIPRTQEGKFIYRYEDEARVHPDEIAYFRSSSLINKENLPDNWFKLQRRMMSEYEYNIEILNIRPRAIGGGFYPMFNEKVHCYEAFNNDYLRGLVDNDGEYKSETFSNLDCREVTDVVPGLPLDIAMDYGKFCCIITGQENHAYEFRFLSSITPEKEGELISVMVERWCAYYRMHPNRDVHYWYDQTATGKDARTPLTYAEIVCQTLRANGWDVIEHYYGSAPAHHDKFNFWSIAMANDHPSLPTFSWNKSKCKYLIESINNSQAKEGKYGPEKVKTNERKVNLDQRLTTHQGDAMDMIGYFKYAHLISEESALFIPSRMMG